MAEIPQVYYVIDKRITSPKLGDVVIKTAGNARFVVMTRPQAQYWLDQCAISPDRPPEEQKKKAAVESKAVSK